MFPGGSECSLSHLSTSRWCKVLKVHLLSRQSFHLWAQREQRDNTNTLFTRQAKQVLTMGIVCRDRQSVLSWNFLKSVVPHFRHFFFCFQLLYSYQYILWGCWLAGWLTDCWLTAVTLAEVISSSHEFTSGGSDARCTMKKLPLCRSHAMGVSGASFLSCSAVKLWCLLGCEAQRMKLLS